jgi:hypothetical protein
MCAMGCKSRRGNQHSTCDNEYTHAIHAGADDLHDVSKGFHACLHSRKARRLSMLLVICAVLSLQNDGRHRVMFGMAKRDECSSDAALCCEFFRRPG